MVHFQGPHFGDRYGIADAAFRALTEGDLSPLAVSCSGASIYLVFRQGEAGEAVRLLEKVFEVPRGRTRFSS
jgi:aspartokinase